jgi:hypothetical protein
MVPGNMIETLPAKAACSQTLQPLLLGAHSSTNYCPAIA